MVQKYTLMKQFMLNILFDLEISYLSTEQHTKHYILHHAKMSEKKLWILKSPLAITYPRKFLFHWKLLYPVWLFLEVIKPLSQTMLFQFMFGILLKHKFSFLIMVGFLRFVIQFMNTLHVRTECLHLIFPEDHRRLWKTLGAACVGGEH